MTGKQLKNSILQWAIQGKLVPQDPNDEPASVLLEKIRAEKAQLIKEGKIKKDKKESIIYRGEDNSYYEKFADGKVVCIDDEIPFEIPKSWSFVRLGVICNYLHRGKTPKYGNQKILPIIAQKCNHWDQLYIDRCLFSDIDYILKYKEEQFLQKGDIIINSTGGGTVGRTGYIDETVFDKFDKFVADSHVTIVRPNKLVSHRYIYQYLLSPYIQIGIEERCTGSTNQIELRTTTISDYLVPIPPVEEQKRIVEKVEFMLPVVTRYEKLQSNLDHLNSTLPSLIKKSILQEAIQGKLVPQAPNDEPASVLLQRIKKEKQRLVKEGKLKKSVLNDSVIFKGDDNKYYEQVGKSITEITEEIPFSIPDSWTWSRLSVVVKIIMGQSPDGNDVFEAEKEDNAYEFHQGKIYFTEKYISPSGKWCKNPPRIANIGSLLVCVRAPIGDVNIVQRQIGIGRGLAAIIGYAKIETDFLYYWILAHKKNLIEKGTGSTFKAITLDVLKNLIIPIPPFAEQKRILSRIELLYDKIEGN